MPIKNVSIVIHPLIRNMNIFCPIIQVVSKLVMIKKRKKIYLIFTQFQTFKFLLIQE